MINLLAADIIERFYAFMWPMLRLSALMLTAPILAQNAVNLRLRILIALVSAPLLLVSLAVGLVIGIIQAATSINEMTLSFIPKLIALALGLSQTAWGCAGKSRA